MILMFRVLILFALVLNAISASAEDLKNIDFDLAKYKKISLYGRTVTVDTRDQSVCKRIQAQLSETSKVKEDICAQNEKAPYVTITSMSQNPFKTEMGSKTLGEFSETDIKHINNLRNVAIFGAAGMLRYAAQGWPQKWKNKENKAITQRWLDHVKKGPHFDSDNFRTNYIEHPIAGSFWYSIARHDGFSILESFGFSVFSSTFIWEYGFEQVLERASINDLIVTPVIGSVLGELAYQIYKQIENNDGRVLGSPALGTAIQAITNPGYFISETVNAVLGENWFDSGDYGWVVENRKLGITEQSTNALLFRMRLKFKK